MGCGNSKQATTADQSSRSPTKDPQQQQQKQQQQKQQQQQPVDVRTVSSKTSSTKQPSNTKINSPRGKYVVTDTAASGTKSVHSDSTFSEATDKGFKRKLRQKLQEVTAGHDIEELEKAMDRFTRHKLDDCGDFTRAQDRLQYLRLRRDLRDAIRRHHVGVLKKTIEEAQHSQFSGQLRCQIEAARRQLHHLQELNEYGHDILNMEQSTISEIHSYQRPPVCVHDVMVATYLLLGHPEPRLTEWQDIQMLLCRVGRDSLIHEIRDFDSAHVDDGTSRRVQDILRPHELHAVRQASNGAAAFYVWTTQICEKVDRDRSAGTHHHGQDDDALDSARVQGKHQPHANRSNHSNNNNNNSNPRKKQKG